jgi:hypothetical protein
MLHLKKKSLALLACLALLLPAATVYAHTVKAPYSGTITTTTYYSSGSFHGAVDVAGDGACNYWGVQTSVVGSVHWDITINTSSNVCYGNGSGNQNQARHVWASGWSFRLWHWNKTGNSYDRTCDRCQIGDEGGTGNATGPHTHLQQDKSGTLDTSWYSGYTVKGEHVDRSETLGVLD